MIASISTDKLILDDYGCATLTINGELPGGALLMFTIEDTDVTAESKIKVVTGSDIVATPTASIKSGEIINPGTILELLCDTEDAVIYYTLDGSCPCDEKNRIKYEIPIVIYSNVIVKAMAIKDDMENSDVATFVYKDVTPMGDVNGDGVINAADDEEVANYIMNRPSEKFIKAAADMNGDGVINAVDIVLITSLINQP